MSTLRDRYLNWPGREAMRLQVIKEQKAALEYAATSRREKEPTTRDNPERGYPKPRRKKR